MKKKLINCLAISTVVIMAVFTLSSFVSDTEITDEVESGGISGSCYTISTYECSGGGFATTCNFTSTYGSPYTCSSVGCGILAYPVSRRCVQKK